MDINNFKRIFGAHNGGTAPDLKAALNAAAHRFLPELKRFRAEGGDLLVAGYAHRAHAEMKDTVPFMLPLLLSQLPLAASGRKGIIAAEINRAIATDVQNDAQNGPQARALTAQLDPAHIAALKMLTETLLPARTLKFINDTKTATSAQKQVETLQKLSAMLSDTQMAQLQQSYRALLPVDLLAETAEKIIENLEPAAIETVCAGFAGKVTAQDFARTAIGALDLLEEAMTLQSSGQSFLSGPYSPKAHAFGNGLKNILQGLEDSIADAGIIPDLSALRTALRAGNEKAEKLQQAALAQAACKKPDSRPNPGPA